MRTEQLFGQSDSRDHYLDCVGKLISVYSSMGASLHCRFRTQPSFQESGEDDKYEEQVSK